MPFLGRHNTTPLCTPSQIFMRWRLWNIRTDGQFVRLRPPYAMGMPWINLVRVMWSESSVNLKCASYRPFCKSMSCQALERWHHNISVSKYFAATAHVHGNIRISRYCLQTVFNYLSTIAQVHGNIPMNKYWLSRNFSFRTACLLAIFFREWHKVIPPCCSALVQMLPSVSTNYLM